MGRQVMARQRIGPALRGLKEGQNLQLTPLERQHLAPRQFHSVRVRRIGRRRDNDPRAVTRIERTPVRATRLHEQHNSGAMGENGRERVRHAHESIA